MKRMTAALALVLAAMAATISPAAATDPLVDSNLIERVQCLFRVYVTEGGEQGLDCLT